MTDSDVYLRSPSSRMALGEVLDRMGAASARAQGLSQVITSMEKLRTSENHIVYIITRKHPDRWAVRAVPLPAALWDIT